MASAVTVTPEYTFPQNTIIDLKRPCFNNGTWCSSISECNMTATYTINSSLLLNNVLMTNQISFHNKTIPAQATTGFYKVDMICKDGTDYGSDSFYFQVTPTGNTLSAGENSIIWIPIISMFVIAFFIFLLGLFTKKLPIKLGLWGFAFLLCIGAVLFGINSLQNYVGSNQGYEVAYTRIFWMLGIVTLCLLIGFILFSLIINVKSLIQKRRFGGE
jgi:hypothetical protein